MELTGDLPRLELFARTDRMGWSAWGNEINRFEDPQQESWSTMWSRPYDFSRES